MCKYRNYFLVLLNNIQNDPMSKFYGTKIMIDNAKHINEMYKKQDDLNYKILN